jgi:hypothetical protein
MESVAPMEASRTAPDFQVFGRKISDISSGDFLAAGLGAMEDLGGNDRAVLEEFLLVLTGRGADRFDG